MSNAAELLTKSSYCRNSKHAKCKTAECGCKCHSPEPVDRIEELAPELLTGEDGQKFEKVESMPKISVEEANAEVSSSTADRNAFEGVDLNDESAVDAVIADVAVAAASKAIADRLDPAKAPAPKPAKKAKAPKEPKPVVVGTIDGKLSNAHKRAIREKMVAHLRALQVDLDDALEGVTAEEVAAYVDTYWVKYIDPARDKARHTK